MARTNKSKALRRKFRRVKSLQKFLKAYGDGRDGSAKRREFAKRVGTSHAYLVHLAWGYRLASETMALSIERASHGLVKREEMRPDTDWAAFAPRAEADAVRAAAPA